MKKRIKDESNEQALFELKNKEPEELKESKIEKDEEKPPFETTTLWDYPKQSYGKTPKGSNKFQGVTPAFIIWNMLQRYTNPDDLVVDPMCGSGTTIDVCEDEGRKVIGFDLFPRHPSIIKNDSRKIPVEDSSVDMVFIDSPYGDNVNYSSEEGDIGKISAEDDSFYDSLAQVASEIYRILKPGKVVGWLIADQWVKKRFTPVGFKTYEMLVDRIGFEPVDLICVTRRNQSSNTGVWHYRARKFNFFLRGFKYLIIVRKPDENQRISKQSKVKWKKYK